VVAEIISKAFHSAFLGRRGCEESETYAVAGPLHVSGTSKCLLSRSLSLGKFT
jgi:hypothetical protein